MHILGKVLIGFTLLGSGFAIYLSAKLINNRNHWTSQIDKVSEQAENLAIDLADKKSRLEAIKTEYEAVYKPWGYTWDSVNVTVRDPQAGTIAAAIGTNNRLTAPAGGVSADLHAFQVNPDGSSTYIGEFAATTVQVDQAAFQPTWPLRPLKPGELNNNATEAQNWRNGAWRFRSLIPSSYETNFPIMYEDLSNTDQNLEEQRKILQIQEKLLAYTENSLKKRQEELIGTADAQQAEADKAKLPIEFSAGLIAAIEDEQAKRNTTQTEINRLRRQMEDSRQRLTQLIENNVQMEKKLPKADY